MVEDRICNLCFVYKGVGLGGIGHDSEICLYLLKLEYISLSYVIF